MEKKPKFFTMSPKFVVHLNFTTSSEETAKFPFLKMFTDSQRSYTLVMQEDVIKCFQCCVSSCQESANTKGTRDEVDMSLLLRRWKLQCLCCCLWGREVAIRKCQLEWIGLFMNVETFVA